MNAPRAVAVLLSLALAAGCATVRTPVASFDDPIAVASTSIEPRLELWVESGDPISEKSQARAAQEARQALADVVSARKLAPHASGATDPLLVVREQAVARTDERRTNQKVAAAGIVVGAALVAVAIIAGAHGSHLSGGAGHLHGGGAHLGGGASSGARLTPAHASGLPPRPAFAHAGLRGSFARGTHGWSRDPHRRFGWSGAASAGDLAVDLVDPSIDLALELDSAQERAAFAEAEREAAHASAEMDEEELPQPPPPPDLMLPAMPPLDLERRGFFDGDDTILEADLFDRASGVLLWSKVVRSNIDPRSRDDVDELLGRALDKASWARDR